MKVNYKGEIMNVIKINDDNWYDNEISYCKRFS